MPLSAENEETNRRAEIWLNLPSSRAGGAAQAGGHTAKGFIAAPNKRRKVNEFRRHNPELAKLTCERHVRGLDRDAAESMLATCNKRSPGSATPDEVGNFASDADFFTFVLKVANMGNEGQLDVEATESDEDENEGRNHAGGHTDHGYARRGRGRAATPAARERTGRSSTGFDKQSTNANSGRRATDKGGRGGGGKWGGGGGGKGLHRLAEAAEAAASMSFEALDSESEPDPVEAVDEVLKICVVLINKSSTFARAHKVKSVETVWKVLQLTSAELESGVSALQERVSKELPLTTDDSFSNKTGWKFKDGEQVSQCSTHPNFESSHRIALKVGGGSGRTFVDFEDLKNPEDLRQQFDVYQVHSKSFMKSGDLIPHDGNSALKDDRRACNKCVHLISLSDEEAADVPDECTQFKCSDVGRKCQPRERRAHVVVLLSSAEGGPGAGVAKGTAVEVRVVFPAHRKFADDDSTWLRTDASFFKSATLPHPLSYYTEDGCCTNLFQALLGLVHHRLRLAVKSLPVGVNRRHLDTFHEQGDGAFVLLIDTGHAVGKLVPVCSSDGVRALFGAANSTPGKPVKLCATLLRRCQALNVSEYDVLDDDAACAGNDKPWDPPNVLPAWNQRQLDAVLKACALNPPLGANARKNEAAVRNELHRETMFELSNMITKAKAWPGWVTAQGVQELTRAWTKASVHMTPCREKEIRAISEKLATMDPGSDSALSLVDQTLVPCGVTNPKGVQFLNLLRLMPALCYDHYYSIFGRAGKELWQQNPASCDCGKPECAPSVVGNARPVTSEGQGSAESAGVASSLNTLVQFVVNKDKPGGADAAPRKTVFMAWKADGLIEEDFGVADPDETLTTFAHRLLGATVDMKSVASYTIFSPTTASQVHFCVFTSFFLFQSSIYASLFFLSLARARA